jgi:hypothetical protein
LIIPIAHDHRVEARSRRTLTECPSALSADWRSQSDDLAVYGAHILRCPLHKPSAVLHSGVLAPQRERRHDRCPRKLVRVCRAVQGLVGPARSFHSRTNVVCSSNIANTRGCAIHPASCSDALLVSPTGVGGTDERPAS